MSSTGVLLRGDGAILLLLITIVVLTEGRPGRHRLQDERHRLEDGLTSLLKAMDEVQLDEVERAASPQDWDDMLADAPFLPNNETTKSLKDSGDPISGRDKEQRIKNIREQVLRFLGRKDNKNITQPNEQQARILQIISKIKLDRPWPSTEVYTELQSFYPSCDLPRNTDEEAWEKGLQMNLFFNLNFSSSGQGALSIQYAKLKLYKLPQGNMTMPLVDGCPGQNVGDLSDKSHYLHFPSSTSSLLIEDKQIRVSVYWYTRGLRKHRVKRKLLDSQMISLYGESWTEYSVRAAVKAWKEQGKNFGISVEVEDEDRVILQASRIFAVMNCSKGAGVAQPVPTAALDGLDNNTREVLNPLSPLFPLLELSTREFPDSELGPYGVTTGGGIQIDHPHRHHHQTELPIINDTMIGGIRWEDPRHSDKPATALR